MDMTEEDSDRNTETAAMEQIRAALDGATSRYPYVEMLLNRSDAVLVPNPDIHYFEDEIK